MTKYNRSLTTNERASLFGDELIALTAAYIAHPSEQTISDYNAALINRCDSKNAIAVVLLKEQIEGLKVELAVLWMQIAALEAARAPAQE